MSTVRIYSRLQALTIDRSIPALQGWIEMLPDWQASYTPGDFDLVTLPDNDPVILDRMAADQAARDASDPACLAGYYDEVLRVADLEKFDPALM